MKALFRLLSVGALTLTVAACANYDPNPMTTTILMPQKGVVNPEPEWIKSDTVVMKQEVRAEGAALVMADDFAAAIGVPSPVNVGAGEVVLHLQMIRLAGNRTIYCQPYNPTAKTGVAKLLELIDYSEICLLDSNNDGVFDQMVDKQSTIFPLPMIWGPVSKPRPVVRPLPYKFDPSGILRSPYYIEILYTGTPLLAQGNRRFEVYGGYSEDSMRPILSDWLQVPIKTLPARLEFRGAIIDILEVDGDRIKIQRTSPIAPWPFTLLQGSPKFIFIPH